jgi:hypothetical protein
MSLRAAALIVALSALAPTAQAADPETVDIVGTYDGNGTDIQGGKYKVTVKIEGEGDAFKFTWTTPGGQKFFGAGIRTGKLVSVGWAGEQGTKVVVGITVYEVQKDGSLKGKWTMLGAKGTVKTETITPSA